MPLSRKATGGIYATICLLLIAGAVVFFAVMSMEERNQTVDTVKQSNVKTDIHDIQVAIEKYAEDHCGNYPGWLIGGEAKYAKVVNTADGINTFLEIQECEKVALVSDPLLREGYLDAYPRNPFVKAGISIHQIQTNLPTAMNGYDPLINGREYCAKLGTRFGANCTLTGNMLGDPRFSSWQAVDFETGHINPCYTYADVDFHHFDMYRTTPPVPHLPGQFFYKSNWRLQPPNFADRPMAREIEGEEATMYMLGAYGPVGEKGQDIFGLEQMIKFDMGSDGEISLYPWTGSNRGSNNRRTGCPYGNAPEGSADQFVFGNPNGIHDSVVMLLTGSTGKM